MIAAIRRHSAAALIVGLFILLGIAYSIATPVFEASDEISHYPVVQYIATTGQLPVQRPGVETLWEQEGSQPPAYYLLGAGLTAWIDTHDLSAVRWRNPHAKLGIPLTPDNKNMVVHTEAEAFPWHGTVLAVHLLRLLGVALGAVTVSLIYRLALSLWPGLPPVAILAAGLGAFNPMFLFISASVNNDTLTVLLCTWAMLLMVHVLQQGLTLRRVATLAMVTALAALSKISGLTLLPLVGAVLLLHAWRTHAWRRAVLAGLAVAGAVLLVAGWWYVRNLILYGELLGLQTHLAIAGTRTIGLAGLASEWYGFWVSYWALFGAVNVLADPGVYAFYGALCGLSLGGVLCWGGRRLVAREWSALLLPSLLALQVVAVFVGLVRWTLVTYASQGRLMFPALAAVSTLMGFGLLYWLPARWARRAGLALSLLLAAIAAIAPFRYIAPTYALPPTVAAVPGDAVPVGARFDGLELVAVETPGATVEPGGRVPITLYLRADRPLAEDYSLYLHALGRGLEELGKIDSYPGGGALPTSRMQPGVIIRDAYWVELKPEFQAPTRVRVQIGVGLYRPPVYVTTLSPTSGDGAPMSSVMIQAGVAYPRDRAGCSDAVPADARFRATLGDFALLWTRDLQRGYHPGETVPVALYWDRRSATPVDWTVFVHLRDSAGQVVAQADGPPLDGDYPTSLWRVACQVADVHYLQLPPDLPPGVYQVYVGLYNAGDAAYPRAPALDGNGAEYPDAAVPLGPLPVEAP